jgi:hypothetical protein
MKRLTLLAAALVMVLGFAVSASAAPEVTVSGNILVNAVWKANWDFKDGNSDVSDSGDTAFNIRQRLDLAFTAVANENLKAVIQFRSTREEFGQGGLLDGAGGAAGGGPKEDGGSDDVILGLNQGYIDFNWPGTSVNVKAGFMPVALPAAVGGGSIIQDDNATAILVSSAINDNVSVLGGWIRFADGNFNGKSVTETDSQIDGWLLALPLNFEGVSATPFFVYSNLSDNALTDTVIGVDGAADDTAIPGLVSNYAGGSLTLDNAWWAGTSFEMSIFDPFILKADFNYGAVNSDNENLDRKGWLFDIALDYTGFDFMNLELAYAYTTGVDDDGDDNRLPVISDSWALGSTWFGGGLLTGDDMDKNNTALGFHALALSATGIQSFAEGLTHDVNVVYLWGNNDKDATRLGGQMEYGSTLLEDDSMLEIDFNSYYKIYDELTLYNGISYMNLDADDDDWGGDRDGGDAWKFQLALKYVF